MIDNTNGVKTPQERLTELEKKYPKTYGNTTFVYKAIPYIESCLVSTSTLGVSGILLHNVIHLTNNQVKFAIVITLLSLVGVLALEFFSTQYNKHVIDEIDEMEKLEQKIHKNKENN